MTSNLSLVTTRNFNGVQFNCYQDENGIDQNDFWATREQIGQLLEYANPETAIKNIHLRNADRLDRFSTQLKLSQVEGTRTITREVIVYNFKGLLEICRYSNQPKANAVMDFLWEIADEIRKTGKYSSLEDDNEPNPESLKIRAAEVLQRIAQLTSTQEQKDFVLNKAFKLVTGCEIPKKEPKKKEKSERFWTASDIAKSLKWLPKAVMVRAENLEITQKSQNGHWEGDIWYFSKEGRKKFLELVNSKIVRIEGDYAYYEDGRKFIYWRFDPCDVDLNLKMN